MYTTEIDNLIDNIFDDFYGFINNKKINDIFVVLNQYIQYFDVNSIKKFIYDENDLYNIVNLIKKYIFIYITLYFGYLHNEKFDDWIVEMINSGNNFSIDNFYNSENTSKIIKLYDILTSSLDCLKKKKSNDFLLLFNEEFIQSLFKVKDIKLQLHNVIKTLILIKIYKQEDRIETFKILEKNEYEKNDFTFIDIVISKEGRFDIQTIEEVLEQNEIDDGIADQFMEMMIEDNKVKNVDEKINELFDSGLIIPIVDDFLLFHKDNEFYEKQQSGKKDKRKSETRLKYIVEKINKMTEYNVVDKKAKDEMIYMPEKNKKAIVVNQYENTKIINKTLDLIEEIENYKEFKNYLTYPYINFKDFDKVGFSFTPDRTLDIVRVVSFEEKNTKVQWRIGSKNKFIDIVGFMIGNSSPMCLNTNMIKKNIDYHDFIKSIIKKEPIYWIFNLDESFKDIESKQTTELLKIVIENIYNLMIKFIEQKIIDKIKKKNISFLKKNDLIDKFSKKYKLKLEQTSYNLFYEFVHHNYEIEIPKKNDMLYGIYGNVKKLPIYKPKINPIEIIKITNEEEKKIFVNIKIPEVICQHQINWNNILRLKHTDVMKYLDEMYKFIKRYVVENYEFEYICKSCGALIKINNFIYDGIRDQGTGTIVPTNIPLEIPLEEIYEYEKLSNVILNIDKIIERIAVVLNVNYYVGISDYVKNRRRPIVKNVIDLIQINNKLKDKKRIDNLKKYNINKEMTNLFFFDLDNSVFKQSKNENDYYKNIKINNIIVYCLVIFLLELDDSNITFITGNEKGICNYFVFEKYGKVLFQDIQIIINRSFDVSNILKYKVLSYLIYMMSCTITKYNLWRYNEKSKKFNVHIQKIIIYTMIDLLNLILESSKNEMIFDILSTKFFSKLMMTYNDETLIKKISIQKKIDKKVEKKEIEYVSLSGKYEPYKLEIFQKKNIIKLNYLKEKSKIKYNYDNLTNCSDGYFHNWVWKNNKLVCLKCNISYNDVKNEKNNEEKIKKQIELNNLINLQSKLCKFVNTVCERKDIPKVLKEIKNEKKILEETTLKKETENLNDFNNEIKKRNIMIKNIKNNLNPSFINEFISILQSIIGKNIKIMNIPTLGELKENIYVFNYDQNGNKLKEPFELLENEITFKKNHVFFKKDVFYYVKGKTEVYYDSNANIFIGLKEPNKSYIKINTDKKVMIKYSVFNELKLLGDNLKNFIYTLIRCINIIINNKIIPKKEDEEMTKLNILIEKYRNKLVSMNMEKNNFMENWILLFDVKLSYDEIIFFVINEILKLISNNEKKNLKEQICYFFIEYLNLMFNEYQYEKNNIDLQRFYYTVQSEHYTLEDTIETYGIYEEYKDPDHIETKEERRTKEDDIEESQALDIDMKIDYEDMYDRAYSDKE